MDRFCDDCGTPIDDSPDFGPAPIEVGTHVFCGVECLGEFGSRLATHALTMEPAITLAEAISMASAEAIVIAETVSEASVRWGAGIMLDDVVGWPGDD